MALFYIFGVYSVFTDEKYDAVDIAAAIIIPPYGTIVGGREIYKITFEERVDYFELSKLSNYELIKTAGTPKKNLSGALDQAVIWVYSQSMLSGEEYERSRQRNYKLIEQIKDQSPEFRLQVACGLLLYVRLEEMLVREALTMVQSSDRRIGRVDLLVSEDSKRVFEYLQTEIKLVKSPPSLRVEKYEIELKRIVEAKSNKSQWQQSIELQKLIESMSSSALDNLKKESAIFIREIS